MVAILLYLPFWLILVLLCFSRRKQAGVGCSETRFNLYLYGFLILNYFLFKIFFFYVLILF